MCKDNIPTFTIDLNKKCVRCHRDGAVNNGLCMTCISKALKNGEFDHILDKHRKIVSKKLKRQQR